MAGKRHHIIPKFLQKGFASRSESETVWTWHYRKNTAEPVEISTKDSIVSEHFYGKGGESADPIITEYETTKLAPLVDALRHGSAQCNDVVKEIAELIAHLTIRTKVVRKGFEEMSERFLHGIGTIFSDDDLIADAIASQPDSYLFDQFDSVFSDPTFPTDGILEMLDAEGISREDVSNAVVPLVRKQLADEDGRREFVEGASTFLTDLLGPMQMLVADSIKSGHIKALRENVNSGIRVEVFESFHWELQLCDFDLVLGDSGTVFESVQHQRFIPLCELDDIAKVILPLSSNRALIGQRDTFTLDKITPQINQHLARCSCEQFVASSHSDEFRKLVPLIGADVALVPETMIAAELDDIRNNLKGVIGEKEDEE